MRLHAHDQQILASCHTTLGLPYLASHTGAQQQCTVRQRAMPVRCAQCTTSCRIAVVTSVCCSLSHPPMRLATCSASCHVQYATLTPTGPSCARTHGRTWRGHVGCHGPWLQVTDYGAQVRELRVFYGGLINPYSENGHLICTAYTVIWSKLRG